MFQFGDLSTRYSAGDKDTVVDPMEVFHKAVDNVKPLMGTTGVRRGGKLYHVRRISMTVLHYSNDANYCKLHSTQLLWSTQEHFFLHI